MSNEIEHGRKNEMPLVQHARQNKDTRKVERSLPAVLQPTHRASKAMDGLWSVRLLIPSGRNFYESRARRARSHWRPKASPFPRRRQLSGRRKNWR